MKLEAIILITVSVISILSLIFIPKSKLFHAQFIFLFVQLSTWILGLTVVQLGLIEYPYRELSNANRTSFLFEFLVLPIMCIHFNVHFPSESSKTIKCIYTISITLAFTLIEYFTQKYTLILKYTGWKTSWTSISIFFVFWLSRKADKWFFEKADI